MTEEEKIFFFCLFFFFFPFISSLPLRQLNGMFNLNVLKLGIKVGKACVPEHFFPLENANNVI